VDLAREGLKPVAQVADGLGVLVSRRSSMPVKGDRFDYPREGPEASQRADRSHSWLAVRSTSGRSSRINLAGEPGLARVG
jgi:hypothetical protein